MEKRVTMRRRNDSEEIGGDYVTRPLCNPAPLQAADDYWNLDKMDLARHEEHASEHAALTAQNITRDERRKQAVQDYIPRRPTHSDVLSPRFLLPSRVSATLNLQQKVPSSTSFTVKALVAIINFPASSNNLPCPLRSSSPSRLAPHRPTV